MSCNCSSTGRRWVAGPKAELGLAGLLVVASSAAHWLRRLVWALVLALALFWLIFQLRSSTERLMKQSVAATSWHTKQPQMPFPAATICPGQRFKSDQVLNMTRDGTTLDQWLDAHGTSRYKLLRWGEIDFDEFFARASYSWTDLVRNCTFHGEPCSGRGSVTPVQTSMFGVCHTLRLDSLAIGTWTEPQLELRLTLPAQDSAAGWQVLLHTDAIRFSGEAILSGLVSYVEVPPAMRTLVRTFKRSDNFISTKEDPCSADISKHQFIECMASCLNKNVRRGVRRRGKNGAEAFGSEATYGGEEADDVAEESRCRLPWEDIHATEGTGTPCKTYSALQVALRFSPDLSSLGEEDIYSAFYRCGCVSPCSEITYPVETPDRIPLMEENSQNSARLGFWLSMREEQRKETWSFTVPQFVAECGGNMGICLGASLLSLVELIDVGVSWVMHKVAQGSGVMKVGVTPRGTVKGMTGY